MTKAVFLDRDGTIIEDRGYLRDPSEVVFLPDAFESLRGLQEEFLLFIVTNQSGVARGEISHEDVQRVNAHVVAELARAGIEIAEVYVCPHAREDGCFCIKPHPHFLREAEKHHGVDLARSFAVGDHPHDVDFGLAGGGAGIYVLTGHGEKHLAELAPDAPVTTDIKQAAGRILTLSAFRDAVRSVGDDLGLAAEVLQRGGIVAFPTETVYGLGANARDASAVARVFEVKRRPRFDPLIVHVSSIDQTRQVVSEWPAAAAELARRFWPGPLTLVLPRSDAVADIVTSGLPTVAVRMPDHPLALALIDRAGTPIAAPSANRFGSISPTRPEHVWAGLGDDAAVVLDGGPCRVGVESTIVSLAGDEPVLLRAGGTPVEQIEAAVGPVQRRRGEAKDRPIAPGQCDRHYAPATPLTLCRSTAELPDLPRTALLTLRRPENPERFDAVEVLSADGDLQEAATNLFAALHRLDRMDLDHILAVPVPEMGLGPAINDRLRRAACKTQDARMRKEKP